MPQKIDSNIKKNKTKLINNQKQKNLNIFLYMRNAFVIKEKKQKIKNV